MTLADLLNRASPSARAALVAAIDDTAASSRQPITVVAETQDGGFIHPARLAGYACDRHTSETVGGRWAERLGLAEGERRDVTGADALAIRDEVRAHGAAAAKGV